ncbi:hypothetical protein MY4038_003045 [Beauveria bassiana]
MSGGFLLSMHELLDPLEQRLSAFIFLLGQSIFTKQLFDVQPFLALDHYPGMWFHTWYERQLSAVYAPVAGST